MTYKEKKQARVDEINKHIEDIKKANGGTFDHRLPLLLTERNAIIAELAKMNEEPEVPVPAPAVVTTDEVKFAPNEKMKSKTIDDAEHKDTGKVDVVGTTKIRRGKGKR